MGNTTIPTRSDQQTIDSSWFNKLKEAFTQNIVPRNSDGIATDEGGSLGESALAFLGAYLKNLYLVIGSKAVKLKAPAGLVADYTLTLPTALPTSTAKPLFMGLTGDVTPQAIARTDLPTSALAISTLATSNGTSYGSIFPSWQDIPNCTTTIITTGRPVLIFMQSDGSTNAATIETASGSVSASYIAIARDGVIISKYLLRHAGASAIDIPSSSIIHLDNPAAGTYTYKIQASNQSAGMSVGIWNSKLVAIEL
jgi:hypothetical protein